MERVTAAALAGERPKLASFVELLKPITWFPPMWAFGCGLVASGGSLAERWPFAIAGIVLAGPLVCGTSQVVNDWFDRHVDAINEPHRPIPSGRVPGRQALYFAIVWTLLSLAVAWTLGPWVTAAAVLGLVLAWAYSAPPVRLKQNGWLGNLAVGLCYEGLPWFTAAAVLSGGAPGVYTIIVALMYSLGAHGIMTLNDFKAIDGDRQMNVRSLPAAMGAYDAARTACIVMALPQLVVVGMLAVWGQPWHALAVGLVVAAQLVLMARFLKDPRGRATWYSAWGVSLYVSGMLISAFAIRGLVA